jgi:general secretion pathway protein M
MIETARDWWKGRSPREQWLLGVMLALLALLLAWLLIVRPLGDAVSDARRHYGEVLTEYQDVRAMVGQLKAADVKGAATTDVRRAVADSAASTGIAFAAEQPLEGGGVLVTISAIRPTALFGWIADLGAHGVIADRISVQKNKDATVTAQVGFAGRAG